MPRAREGLIGITIRMPSKIHDRLVKDAKAAKTSLNKEMCRRLEQSFDYEGAANYLRKALGLDAE